MRFKRLKWYVLLLCGTLICLYFLEPKNVFLNIYWKNSSSPVVKQIIDIHEQRNFTLKHAPNVLEIGQDQAVSSKDGGKISSIVAQEVFSALNDLMKGSFRNSNGSIRRDKTIVKQTKIGRTTTSKVIYVYNRINQYNYDVNDTRWESIKAFQKCPISNCILSKKKSSFNTADAVIFRAREILQCPTRTSLGQIWIFLEFESPEYFNRPEVFTQCNTKVNWTMTYRRDSDIPVTHGAFRVANQDKRSVNIDFKSKTKMAVVFLSHCNDVANRLQFIRKLQSYGVKIDIYGACGKLKCEANDRFKVYLNISKQEEDNCFNVLDNYKFYISFENSLCVDYITEKSMEFIMKRTIIPIVRSGGNNTLFHPPKSFIDVNDFPSIKQLAKHIIKVFKDELLYNEYHKWRQFYQTVGIREQLDNGLCKVCERVHNADKYRRLYNRLDDWFFYRRKTKSLL